MPLYHNYVSNAERFEGIGKASSYPFLGVDLMRTVCGDKIGSGQYRDVYESKLIPGHVVKVTLEVKANWNEFNMWDAVQGTPYAKWFAPVKEISPGGHFLFMKKARPLPKNFKLPKAIPDILEDIKEENFGLIGKQLVCVDYQFINRMVDIALPVTRHLVFKK